MTTQEEWRPVRDWEGIYEVSSNGRLRSLARRVWHSTGKGFWRSLPGQELRGRANRSGHLGVALSRGNVRSHKLIHRLVLDAFVGPCPDGLEACHGDGDPTNNALSNLRWDTRGANMADAVRHGTHTNAKKTECLRGHPYTPENTMRNGLYRMCRTCHGARDRRHRRQQSAAKTTDFLTLEPAS